MVSLQRPLFALFFSLLTCWSTFFLLKHNPTDHLKPLPSTGIFPYDVEIFGNERKFASDERKRNNTKWLASKKEKKNKKKKTNVRLKKAKRGKKRMVHTKNKIIKSFRVHWHAPFWSKGGYSTEASAMVRAVEKFLELGLYISHHGDSISRDHMDGMNKMELEWLRKRELVNPFVDSYKAEPTSTVVICHAEPGSWNPPKYNTMWMCPPNEEPLYSIGRTMFETTSIPKEWVERCNEMDQIWVPTYFHHNIFLRAGVASNKLVVVPEPIDTNLFRPLEHRGTEQSPRVGRCLTQCDSINMLEIYNFLSIFKFEVRKGWDILLKAFITEFTAKDNVALTLLTNPYHDDNDISTSVAKILGNSNQQDNPPIFLIDFYTPQDQLLEIYQTSDAFVLPSRGEGWGRPIVEAMAVGLPVIVTNWSGPTAYLDETNGFPVEVEGLDIVNAGPFRKHHKWARPSIKHLQLQMRAVVEDKEEGRRRGRKARADMIRKFSLEKVGEEIAQRLLDIEKWLKTEGEIE